MALNGNFVSFQSIIEGVYRTAGYQTIDWGEAVEVIAETIRLIGVLPAYKDITTNGLNDNPTPLEITDYRVAVPTNLVSLKAARRVTLTEMDDGAGGTSLQISSFAPMVEATDLFYQSIREQWNEEIPSGTYNYTSLTQVETGTLSGTSGTANITGVGGLTKVVTFDTDLTTTAANFVTTNAAAYLVEGIVLTSSEEDLIFTASVSGTYFTQPVITNTAGDLTGTVVGNTALNPVIVYGQEYRANLEAQYEYKVNNGYIYTNFETGYIEVIYTGFVVDDHGLPMVPDDQRFIEAIKWSLIKHLDYKKWRLNEIPRDVFQYSDQQRDWYIASARNKADIPSIDKMEAMKNMFLRSIPKVDAHSSYFKYSNVAEKRYTGTSGSSGSYPNYRR